jgi:predicted DNA repair protein MutK
MAGGLFALLDDVAALAKAAAASIDDVGVAAGKASAKAAGVVVDDTAVTPHYVHGLSAERELPIIKRIAKGSLKNKLLFILPAALLLSQFLPIAVEIILMCGGTYLCYEGAHKIHHKLAHRGGHHAEHAEPAESAEEVAEEAAEEAVEEALEVLGHDHEESTVKGAIRTDFILSGEIMVIALKDVIDEGFVSRTIILMIVAVLITFAVYGVVALIVKMDDIGVHLVENGRASSKRLGHALVGAMPKVLAGLSIIGTAAMLWVGGHILLVGTDELGWHGPYDLVHDLEHEVHDVALGGVLGWLINTAFSALVGVVVGFVVVGIVRLLPRRKHAA